jgi:hypothetical protein
MHEIGFINATENNSTKCGLNIIFLYENPIIEKKMKSQAVKAILYKGC